MRYKKAKLFWVNENNNEVINSIPYDDKMEYYTFLRNCKTKGYRQVIVTTEIMIQIMRMFVVEKHFTVNKIELAEEDVDLDNEIVSIIKKTQKESIYFCDLLYKMKFIEERSSIDIKKMVIKGEYD